MITFFSRFRKRTVSVIETIRRKIVSRLRREHSLRRCFTIAAGARSAIKPKFIPRTVVYGLKGEDNTNLHRVVAHAA